MNNIEQRKATPIWSGVLCYFPDAIAAVARLSKKGNDKHNPGEPLHWSRDKSNDHGDCILRHQMEPDAIDPDTGELHAVAVAWRALAQLQLLEEKRMGKDITARDVARMMSHSLSCACFANANAPCTCGAKP
jgi:hypothetical protein